MSPSRRLARAGVSLAIVGGGFAATSEWLALVAFVVVYLVIARRVLAAAR